MFYVVMIKYKGGIAMLAIKMSEHAEFGCPNCGCDRFILDNFYNTIVPVPAQYLLDMRQAW